MKLKMLFVFLMSCSVLLGPRMGFSQAFDQKATGQFTDYGTVDCYEVDWKQMIDKAIENGTTHRCRPGTGFVEWLERNWSKSLSCVVVHSGYADTIWRYDVSVSRKALCSPY
ncbi:MAG: hypothetical protein NTV34_20240 [Proteobacteria bacterium]|nr:hypothetical protein [Pseudomonadota bacterium]